MTDRARSLNDGVNYCHLEDWLGRRVKGRFLRASTAKGERPAQSLVCGQKA